MASLGADTFTQQQIRQSANKALKSADNSVTKEIKEELARVSKSVDDVVDITRKIYRNVKYEDFIKTFKATEEQYQVAFKLWGEEKWDELYKYFKENDLNNWNGINWPPYSGFSEVKETIFADKYTFTIDRFQKETSLGGGFGSPILRNGEGVESLIYTYDSRMLSDKLDDGIYYFSFKMSSKSSDVQLKIGNVAPWFNRNVNLVGEQIEFLKKLHTLDAGYFTDVQAMVRVNGQWRKCVIEGKSVVTEIQDILNKLPKNIADDIANDINKSKDKLNYFKNAQKTGKINKVIEVYIQTKYNK